MSGPFLQLGEADRREIFQSAAAELGITAQILEKDVWVCWALGKLFALPDAKPMAFKGGTSLSKTLGGDSSFFRRYRRYHRLQVVRLERRGFGAVEFSGTYTLFQVTI